MRIEGGLDDADERVTSVAQAFTADPFGGNSVAAADCLPLGGEQQSLLSRWPPRVHAFFVVSCARSSLRQDRPTRRSEGSPRQRQ